MNTPAPRSSKIPAKLPKGFVELLGRSCFSFLQAASHPEEMVEQAIRLDYAGIGLCDLNGLYGVARGYTTMKSPSLFTASLYAKKEFKYVLGSEITLSDETQITLMPMNKDGYQQLCALLTLGKREVDKGFSKLSFEDVAANSKDLLAFALPPWSEERFHKLSDVFHDRLYLPVWKDLSFESIEIYSQAIDLERNLGAQLFATNRPFMHDPVRKPLFDVMTCISHKTTLEKAKNILIQNRERYLRPLSDLSFLWQERLDLLEKTLEIAARVQFSLAEIRYRYPDSNLPVGMNSAEYLKQLCEAGLSWRYGSQIPEKARQLLKHELEVIKDLQYEDYFLTLYEVCEFARQEKILFQGRGSAANSVVCFTLGLTSIDPTSMDLLFERFISRERAEPPDIDIDFEHERREEVIQHIYKKYGESHAAMVCTVIRFRSRMALREVCKVFNVDLKTVNAMVKFMGRDGTRRLLEDGVCKSFGIDQKQWSLILLLTKELHGFPRHLGIHTGGFLITQNPITEMVPVEKATMNGRYVIQWNKDDVNNLGLMKIDMLSLGMLTALKKCFALLQQHKNLNYNLATLPAEDKITYDMICKADTIGVFQIESRAQMNTLPRLKPRNFYDLVVEIALIRPGPLQGGMVHPYLKRRQGLEPITYPHPNLIPVLQKTSGVPIFQEQVMKMMIIAAQFTPGEADELRRIMSNAWRKQQTMDGIRRRIMKGLADYGISDQYAEKIYKTVEGFANYGFPESHSASFALLTYASCYIKCHHPDVFACALLNSQPMGFYAPRNLILDAQHHGVVVEPVDLRSSFYDYTLEKGCSSLHKVRTGFRSLYGIPEKFLRALVDERENNGHFTSLENLVRRTHLPKVVLVKLAASGALRCFSEEARQLIWKLESISLDQNSFLWGQPKENFKQKSFEKAEAEAEEEEGARHISFESNWQRMRREYQSSGFSTDLHPMQILRSTLEERSENLRQRKLVPFTNSKTILSLRHDSKLRVAGLISITQRPPTAKGFCFITLEDELGFMNIIIPPDIYQKDRVTIYGHSLIEVQGHLEVSGDLRNVKAERILALYSQTTPSDLPRIKDRFFG